MDYTVVVWSTVEDNKRRFWAGRKPGKSASRVGEFTKLYDPNTGTTSERWSYQPANHAQQPTQEWLYDRMPR